MTSTEKCSGSKKEPRWSGRKVVMGLLSSWLLSNIRTDNLLRKSVSVIFAFTTEMLPTIFLIF